MTFLKKLGAVFQTAEPAATAVPAVSASHLLASLLTMAWFVEARDPYTGGHLWRVSRYARLLAEQTGADDATAARIGLGGFLHDLGKVGVPDAILRKPERLTDDEYDVIKTHPSIGMRMLAGHPLASLVRDAIYSHHERPDGNGYPQGLKSEQISDMAAMVGICDAFDAMTSSRPYRAGMPRDKALGILLAEKGGQFHAGFTDTFVALGHAGVLDHVMGHSDEGIPLQSCPMCGPTLALRRDQRAGDKMCCSNCTGEFKLVQGVTGLVATPTGQQGKPVDLEPQADTELIQRTVMAAVAALPAGHLLQAAVDLDRGQ